MDLIESISEAYDLSSDDAAWTSSLRRHLERYRGMRRRLAILAAHAEAARELRQVIRKHEECSRSLRRDLGALPLASPRVALRYVIEASERFRGLPVQHAAQVEAIWTGLYLGQWSIVDHYEHHGCRFFFLYRTDIGEGDPLRFTHLQRGALRGLGDAEIAGSLGIKQDAASALVRSVRRKIRVQQRRELIGLNDQCLRAIHLRSGFVECALLYSSTALTEILPATISDAERSILRLQIEGKSNSEIAQIRRVTYKTVSNQVATAYSKLNVRTAGEMLHNLRVACR